uniref:Pentapeptide repeat-containing protein n=1 Tax=Candidatus Kentrum sp. MB TaxID=2138164 RepID=A0A450XER7_9GAMM|nr:MAG: Pentapeptide repeat-containing protein [Candidatus Kentron sp. MB]VFK27785.1 MAG: Pentapeptide repeat-containing protein [Candidatus Kentron sp. MB]VFK74433.1 MAG: Pentapeptide repeat-containing protein [Candidatus Kentron sp. MB]
MDWQLIRFCFKDSVALWIVIAIVVGVFLAVGGYLLLGWTGPAEKKDWPWASLSALAAAPSLLLTWYWRTIHKQKDIDTAREQAQLDEQRLLTERFIRAVELLGNKKLQIRLGGIYALERITQDSPRDHWTVMEVLCAFVRERSRESKPIPPEEQKFPSGPQFYPPDTDVQAALTVIGRRGEEQRVWERKENKRLDLHNVHLERADFSNTDFSGANFRWAHLSGANLSHANFQRVDFWKANLKETFFRDAFLEEALFSGAQIIGANTGGIDLSKVQGITQEQFDSADYDVRTIPPEGIINKEISPKSSYPYSP